jgi:hypothetical protein
MALGDGGAAWLELVDGEKWDVMFWDGAAVRDISVEIPESAGDPRIEGSRVVWMGQQSGDIYLFDGVSTRSIAESAASLSRAPLEGGRVVWSARDDEGDEEIYLWVAGITRRITDNDREDTLPVIGNGWVLWESREPGGSAPAEIHAWDGLTLRALTDSPGDDRGLDADGGEFAWLRDDGETRSILFWRAGEDSEPEMVVTTAGRVETPRVSAGRVAWLGQDGEDMDVFAWTGAAILQLTDNDTDESLLDLDEDLLAWVGEADGRETVFTWHKGYLGRFTTPPFEADSPSVNRGRVAWILRDGGDASPWRSRWIPENMVLNPGFEEGQGDAPDSWAAYSDPPSEEILFGWVFGEAHTGQRCVKIENRTGGGQQASWLQGGLPIGPGAYRFRAFVRASGLEYTARITLFVLDPALNLRYMVDSVPVYASPEWQEVSTRFTVFRYEEHSVLYILLTLFGDGEVWFDDVLVAPDLDPTWPRYAVRAEPTGERLRSLRGTNVGPLTPGADYTAGFARLGLDAMRAHDYYQAFDMHVIFPDLEADPEDPASYDFSETDSYLAPAIEAGVDVLFRLGESWEETPTHVPDPEQFEVWAAAAGKIVAHYNAGWADGHHYGIRYWEIWNEPDIPQFWTLTAEDYYRFYDLVAERVLEADPGALVGGPCMADIGNTVFWRGFLDHVAESGAPLDFFSWHTYYPWDPSIIAEVNEMLREELDGRGFTECRIVVDEWNLHISLYSGLPWETDDPIQAAHAVATIAYAQEAPVDELYRYRTDGEMFGLFDDLGGLTASGMGYLAYAELRDAPFRLPWSGGDRDGRTILPGASEDGRELRVLVTDCYSGPGGYELRIDALPSGAGTYEVLRYDARHRLDTVREGDFLGDSFVLSIPATPPFLDLVRVTMATPTPTPQPTRTPDPGAAPGLDLQLNAEHYRPGDAFLLTLSLDNPGPERPVWLLVALGFLGHYYFWPEWTEEIAGELRTLDALASSEETLLDFTWPEGSGSAAGVIFWGALLDESGREFLALDGEVFGFAG